MEKYFKRYQSLLLALTMFKEQDKCRLSFVFENIWKKVFQHLFIRCSRLLEEVKCQTGGKRFAFLFIIVAFSSGSSSLRCAAKVQIQQQVLSNIYVPLISTIVFISCGPILNCW